MREYIVYRHGWADSNQNPDQGLPERMPVARIEANSPDEACRLAAKRVTLTPQQHLSAEPAEEVDARETNRNLRAEAL
jgi:hypothetical protein